MLAPPVIEGHKRYGENSTHSTKVTCHAITTTWVLVPVEEQNVSIETHVTWQDRW